MSESSDDDIFNELEEEINNMDITDEDRQKFQERSNSRSIIDINVKTHPLKIIDINFNDIIKYQSDKGNYAVKEYIRSGCEINDALRGTCTRDIKDIYQKLLTEMAPINKNNNNEYFEVYRAMSNKYTDVSQGFISSSNILLTHFGSYNIKIYVPLNLPILVGDITSMLSNIPEYKNKTIYEIILPPMTPLKYIDTSNHIDNYIVTKNLN